MKQESPKRNNSAIRCLITPTSRPLAICSFTPLTPIVRSANQFFGEMQPVLLGDRSRAALSQDTRREQKKESVREVEPRRGDQSFTCCLLRSESGLSENLRLITQALHWDRGLLARLVHRPAAIVRTL